MNINRLRKLNDLITNDLNRQTTIILNPNLKQSYHIKTIESDIIVKIDDDDWVISKELKRFVIDVAKSTISNEEKILKIYQKICEDYTYDDNVLSYIKKNDDGTYFLQDMYDVKMNSNWKRNRNKHNRRNCFEISRILAKAINVAIKLSGYSKNYDVCIICDEANVHHFVGLACNEYYISLDLDDFMQIKDLTRMKTSLTLEGIKILEDSFSKFGTVIKKFNKHRTKSAKEHIKKEIEKLNQDYNLHNEKSTTLNDSIDLDDINFLQHTIQILKENYNLDSAGMYEYLKEIIDTKIGAKFRKKVWKEVENDNGIGTIYTRCLIVTINNISYIIDVTKDNSREILQQFDEKELERQDSKVILFNKMVRK